MDCLLLCASLDRGQVKKVDAVILLRTANFTKVSNPNKFRACVF